MTTAPNSLSIFFCILGLGLFACVVMLARAIQIVPENIRLSVFRFGRYIGDKGPGLVLLLPFGIDFAVRFDVSDQMQRARGQQQMWGVIGETQTPVHTDGHVGISGQIWSAVSHEPLPAGTKVRVVKVVLEVERVVS
jgi:regulator of protease activity HflC (stomatin/prohibitin superfamily)